MIDYIKKMGKMLIKLWIIFPVYYLLLLIISSVNNEALAINNISSNLYTFLFYFLLLLPIILFFIIKDKIKYYMACYIVIIAYAVYGFIISSIYTKDIHTFSKEKWNNSQYCNARYYMMEDFESKYNLVGMTEEEVYNLLGNTNSACGGAYRTKTSIIYTINPIPFDPGCLFIKLDENNIVISYEYTKGH